jgi:WD40 repeat protein
MLFNKITNQLHPLKCKKQKFNKIFIINRRESPIWSLAWAHPRFGNIIAVSSFDGEVSVWKETRTNEWHKIACHNGHQASVNSLKWAPEDHDLILISGSSDGIFKEKSISIFKVP